MAKRKVSPQSKSFIILLAIAVVGTYVCLFLLNYIIKGGGYSLPQDTYQPVNPRLVPEKAQAAGTQNQTAAVDTSAWKKYTNQKYAISFLYDPTWKILAPKLEKGFQAIEIDPGKKYYNIKIYISSTGFYAVDGLPSKTESINGTEATNIEDLLFAMQKPPYYYTFDVGMSISLMPQFDALVRSVTFTN